MMTPESQQSDRSLLRAAQRLLAGGLLVAAVMYAPGCGVSGPDESEWLDAAEYGWQFAPGDSLLFEHGSNLLDASARTDTVFFDVTTSSEVRYGAPMLQMRQRALKPGDRAVTFLFASLADTAAILGPVPCLHAALAEPLVVGNSWPAAYRDTAVIWTAKITARFDYRKVHDAIYDHVLEVEYHPTSEEDKAEKGYWRCYYARKVGLVDAVNLHQTYPNDDHTKPPIDGWFERWVYLGRPSH